MEKGFENKMLAVWPKQDDVSVLKSAMQDMPIASDEIIEQLYVDFCKAKFDETWKPVTVEISKQFRAWVIEDAS